MMTVVVVVVPVDLCNNVHCSHHIMHSPHPHLVYLLQWSVVALAHYKSMAKISRVRTHYIILCASVVPLIRQPHSRTL